MAEMTLLSTRIGIVAVVGTACFHPLARGVAVGPVATDGFNRLAHALLGGGAGRCERLIFSHRAGQDFPGLCFHRTLVESSALAQLLLHAFIQIVDCESGAHE